MNNTGTYITWTIPFWMFIVIKVGGTAFASWSWWWVLLPIVPCITFILNATGVSY